MSLFFFSIFGGFIWVVEIVCCFVLTDWLENSITGSVYAEVTRMCLSLSFVSGDIVEMERQMVTMLARIAA